MTVNVHSLEAEAMTLSPELRAQLAESLLQSLESLTEAEIERLWLDEAQRRDAEMGPGGEQRVAAKDALANARNRRT